MYFVALSHAGHWIYLYIQPPAHPNIQYFYDW